jgi:hypothetical protein
MESIGIRQKSREKGPDGPLWLERYDGSFIKWSFILFKVKNCTSIIKQSSTLLKVGIAAALRSSHPPCLKWEQQPMGWNGHPLRSRKE